MGYNKENYQRIRSEYETKPFRAQEEADVRRREIYAIIPRIKQLDDQLAQFGLRLFQASLNGENVDEETARLHAENARINKERAALLMENGYPADYTEPQYECKDCKDSGFVGIKMCACMRRRLTEAGMASSGLSALMKKQSFDNFSLDYYRKNEREYRIMEHNYKTARKYAEQFSLDSDPEKRSGSLLLVGGTGLGKTHLSTAIAREIIEKGYDVFYNTALGMISDFQFSRFKTGTSPAGGDNTERYEDCDLLIIDDLGTEVINQFTVSCMYKVIDTRLNMNKPTIISTNLTSSELLKAYSDRITSRLMGEYILLPFYGTDIRQQKLKG